MGVTCADIGAYTKDGEQLTAPCSGGLGTGAIIGIIVGGLVAVAAVAFALMKTIFKPKGVTAPAKSKAESNVASA